MIEFLTTLPEGLSQLAFWVLVVMSFVGSFITAALGFGGGAVDGVFWGVGGNANTLMLPSSRMLISPRIRLVLMKEL